MAARCFPIGSGFFRPPAKLPGRRRYRRDSRHPRAGHRHEHQRLQSLAVPDELIRQLAPAALLEPQLSGYLLEEPGDQLLAPAEHPRVERQHDLRGLALKLLPDHVQD